ncbi:MAG: MGMT family protein [Clostridia bacterium]|nr:MGMT family protein [Clostridia bacterium]
MRNLNSKFNNKEIDYNKLIKYGFTNVNGQYIIKVKIFKGKFEIIITISDKNKISKLIDLANGEEYVLVDIENATGEFIGNVKLEYETVINDVIEKCTVPNIFKNEQSKQIIKYIKNKYNDELEFLWEKYSDSAIWRNKINNKWYGVLLKVPKNRLGISSDEIVEIIDLRYNKESIEEIIDNKIIFPGFHMNKKSWITMKLDNSLETNKIIELIANSYNLSLNDKTGMKEKELSKKVFEYLRLIPKGKVVTYKQVAEYLGNKGLARVVGNILRKNPDGDKYPCYKVVNGKGELAEAFVFGGKNIQKERLEKEGIEVIDNKVDLKVYQWE